MAAPKKCVSLPEGRMERTLPGLGPPGSRESRTILTDTRLFIVPRQATEA